MSNEATMTVARLRDALASLPADARVCVETADGTFRWVAVVSHDSTWPSGSAILHTEPFGE